MKAKITKTDGTIVEVEGTVEEIQRLVGSEPTVFPMTIPVVVPCGLPHYTPEPQKWIKQVEPTWCEHNLDVYGGSSNNTGV